MNKYLKFKLSGGGTTLVPIGSGAYAELATTTEVKIFSCDSVGHHYSLTTTGATFDMITAIQEACIQGAQTSWVHAVVEVNIPLGQTVASAAVTAFA
tara:strand:- start:953 stop:1243 length:291 start_codon:yes stop_codon:yes gene_type:complete